MLLLIHPPVMKPCEPPAGIAKLNGVLNHFGVKAKLLDANIEGLIHLLKTPVEPKDTWTKRASRNFSANLASIKSLPVYQNLDRYKRAVNDLNHLLGVVAHAKGARLSLTNYQDQKISPLKSKDLIKAAEQPEQNPFFPYFKARLLEIVEHDQPSVVGFSLNYLSQAICTFAMVGLLRRKFPGLKLILGGGLVTSWVKKPGWKDPFNGLIDHLIPGPGEYPLLSLIGITGKNNSFCLPDYTSLPLKEYLSPGLILPYSASNGCYWNKCSFCPERAEGNPYVPVPVDKVLTDLHALVKQTKPVLIHFLDNSLSPALLTALSSHPLPVPWYGFTRITSHLTDLDFCRALKQSGCVMLKIGLESGDQKVLDSLHKGINLKEASQALKTLKKAGIAAYVYLIFGTVAENLSAAKKTRDFVVKHCDYIDFLNLALFNLPIYGPEVEMVEAKNFYEGDLSLYTDFFHPQGWNRIQVREFLDKEFTRHPAIASIVRKEPPFFTSNHATFFVIKSQRLLDSTFPLPYKG
jgi:hypothetical protein